MSIPTPSAALSDALAPDDVVVEKPEPCTDEARAGGCTCRLSNVHATDIDPPEPVLDEWCPMHGRDPDWELQKWRDRE